MPSAAESPPPQPGALQPLPLALGLGAFALVALRLAQDGWRRAKLLADGHPWPRFGLAN